MLKFIKMKNIFTKIFISYIAVILIFAALAIYFSFDAIREYEQNTLIQNLINQNRSIIFYITPIIKENRISNLDSLIKILGKDIETRIQ